MHCERILPRRWRNSVSAMMFCFALAACDADVTKGDASNIGQTSWQTATGSPENGAIGMCNTTEAKVRDYFADLERALQHPEPLSQFNRFIAPRFFIGSKSGRYLYFDLEDVGAVTPSRISLDDWRKISSMGMRELQDAGYRGCMLVNGKAWFDSYDSEGRFGLRGIDHSRSWSEGD